MSRARFVMLLIAALLAISGALFLSTQRNLARDPHGMPLIPSLANELNTVTSLSVRKGGATPTVTIHKQGNQWTVADRADYPADVTKLRNLLLALGDAKIREEKTSNPANFSIIGVEDPTLPGAMGAQVELIAQDGKHAVVVGKSVGEGNFVRRAGENTSYMVEPGISFEADPRFWIDARLLDLPAAKIQSIEAKLATAAGYSLHRTSVAGNDAAGPASTGLFTLDGVPKGRMAADSQTLAPSPTTFSGLNVEDVAPARDIDFSMPSVVTVTMSDGNVIAFTGCVIGNKRWIEVTASKDAVLNAKTAGRAFEITSYRYDAIFRPLERLLVPKEPIAAPKKSAQRS
jgi:Domain of unknown function (DUF4340)